MINRFFIKTFFVVCTCLLLTSISFGQNSYKTQISFNTSIAEDATPAVLAKLMAAKDEADTEMTFEKGVYHFYPDKALEKYLYISNHGDELVRIAFPLTNKKNFALNGQGATFIFHGVIIPFLVENCENVTVRNLTIDWAMSFHSEGLVVANNPVKNSFDLQISDKYPYEIRNGQIYFVKEYYEHPLGQTILYDPKTKAIAFQTEEYTPLTTSRKTNVQHAIKNIRYKYPVDTRAPEIKRVGSEDRLVAEQLKPGLVRIHNHGKKLPPVGTILTAKGEQGSNRVAPAFRLKNTSGFLAENVMVHHASGMGLIAENSADITLNRFNVMPSQGRMVSVTADATHFVGCRGSIKLNNCTLQNQLDDALNVHGTYQEVVEILDERSIGVRMGHFQQRGFEIGRSGDTIGLVRLSESFTPYQKRTLNSINRINARYQILTFNENLPEGLKAGDLVENLDAYPEVLVENCNISRNRARGLLISTPRKTIVRNNFFGTEMEAILVPVESSYWFESGSAADLTITNNTFKDCSIAGFDRGVIRFVTDDENKNIAFTNINISNNHFQHYDNLILEIANTDGLVFKRNTITNSGTFPMLFPKNPIVKVKTSKNIFFDDNKYAGKAKVMVETDKDMAPLAFD